MKKTLWILFYIFLFCFIVWNSFSYLDPDFGWHLRSGEVVWQTKDVPHDQIYMWTLAGKTWVDHEWLSDLLTFGLWSAGGYITVTLFFALLPLLTIWLANRYAQARWNLSAESGFLLACFEIAILFAMRGHIGVRMQEFTPLFLVLLLIIIDSIRRSGSWRYLLWTLPLCYFWACLHGGFLIAHIILISWLMFEWFIFSFPKLANYLRTATLPRKTLWLLSGIACGAIALTFATPYGTELYSFLGGYRDNYFMSHIQEWLPPYAHPVHYSQLAMIILSLALAAWLVFSRKREAWLPFLVTLSFSFLALRSTRHFPLLAIAALVLVAPRAFIELAPRLSVIQRRLISLICLICLSVVCIVLVMSTRPTNTPFESYCSNYPCAAMRYLQEHPEYNRGQLFNHYNFGGFLIGAWPDLRLFIDGRLPQYPLRGQSALAEFNLFNNKDTAAEQLKKYDISTVFYAQPRPEPEFDLFEKWVLGYGLRKYQSDALVSYLTESTDWKRVYEDERSVIFIRQNQK